MFCESRVGGTSFRPARNTRSRPRSQFPLEPGRRHFLTPMNYLEQLFQRHAQPFAVGFRVGIRKRRQKLHIADQYPFTI